MGSIQVFSFLQIHPFLTVHTQMYIKNYFQNQCWQLDNLWCFHVCLSEHWKKQIIFSQILQVTVVTLVQTSFHIQYPRRRNSVLLTRRLSQAEIKTLRSGNIMNQNLLTFNSVKHYTTQLKHYLCGCSNIVDVFLMYSKRLNTTWDY